MKRRRHPNECPACHGIGQTKETATEVRQEGERYRTVARGSGCPACLGIGRIAAKQSRLQ